MTLLSFLSNDSLFAQKRALWEIQPFLGTALSFSKPEQKFSPCQSPPQFGWVSGIQLSYTPLTNRSLWTYTSSYASLDLSISSAYQFRESKRGVEHVSGAYQVFDVWSLGIQRQLTLGRWANLYLELGERLHMAGKKHSNYTSIEDHWLDSGIVYQFDNLQGNMRRFTLVPYVASGIEFHYKRFRIGPQFWYQRSWVPLFDYQQQLQYGTQHFDTRIVSHGSAFGAQLMLRLICF